MALEQDTQDDLPRAPPPAALASLAPGGGLPQALAVPDTGASTAPTGEGASESTNVGLPEAKEPSSLGTFNDKTQPDEKIKTDLATQNQDTKTALADIGSIITDRTKPPPVQIPQPDQLPQTAVTTARGALSAFQNPLMWLAIAGSMLTRKPALAALTAATGVMQGEQERNDKKAKLHAESFKNSVKQMEAQNARELADYNTVLKSDMTPAEKLADLAAISSGHNDPILRKCIGEGNLAHCEQIIEGRTKMQESLAPAKKKYDQYGGGLTPAQLEKKREFDILHPVDEEGKPVPKAPKAGKDDSKLQAELTPENLKDIYEGNVKTKDPRVVQAVRDWAKEQGLAPYDPSRASSAVVSHVSRMKDGTEPPVIQGAYGERENIQKESERQGFDHSKALLQWNQANAEMRSLNSQRMIQFTAVAKDIPRQAEEVKLLAQQMDQGGIGLLNQAQLAAYIHGAGNSENGKLATRYISAVNTLKEMFANFAPGGYAPTESVWALANKQIDPNYGAKQQAVAVEELQRAIQYRLRAISGLSTMGPGSPNRYIQPDPSQVAPSRAPSKSELEDARKAIKDGAPRDAVIKMMQDNGIDPGGL